MSGQFTFYNNYINNCEPGNPVQNEVIYDAMLQCAQMGDGCYGITMNTGVCDGLVVNESCYTSTMPDPSDTAKEIYFCASGELQWAGNLNQNWVSAIKWTGRDVFNGNLPPDPQGPGRRHRH